jgi:hypothetical protein
LNHPLVTGVVRSPPMVISVICMSMLDYDHLRNHLWNSPDRIGNWTVQFLYIYIKVFYFNWKIQNVILYERERMACTTCKLINWIFLSFKWIGEESVKWQFCSSLLRNWLIPNLFELERFRFHKLRSNQTNLMAKSLI